MQKGEKAIKMEQSLINLLLENRDLVDVFCDVVAKQQCIRSQGVFRPLFFSAGTHVLVGSLLGSTPDGRMRGEPVSNALSPANGTEKNGPTAVFNSITKLNTEKMSCGMSLNMRLVPALFKRRETREKLADLLISYFQRGGMHVQFNVVDQEDLIDAQIHPQNYQDLVIRVSGYNACFIHLEKALQDDIIDRYQFEIL